METLESADAVAPLLPGYEMTRELGRGSNSTVWLGTRLKDRQLFAVKCPRGGTEVQALGNAAREVMLLSHLKHQHIVRVYEVLQPHNSPGGPLGIVMDYAAGGSLANLVSGRKRLSVGETVTVLTPIAQALSYLHANGVVHGDVSPGNVLFTAVGMPLLADLGLAARLGDSQQNLDAGTAGFRDPFSPVSLNPVGLNPVSSNPVSPASATVDSGRGLRPQRDVYSLGALGWYCLTGVVPGPPQLRPPLSLLVPGVPKTMAAVLEAALDPDPLARPTAKEFATAVFRSAAPGTLDLSGAVHRSVIPELLTRREALGRSPRRIKTWLRWPRKLLPLPQAHVRAGIRAPRTSRRALFVRLGLVAVGGVVLCGVAWTVLQQAPVEPAPIEHGSAAEGAADSRSVGPGPSLEPAKADDLPDDMAAALRAEDPAVAVVALSAVRDVALREGRLELLDLVNAHGSPAAESDQKLREQLQESGTSFAGLRTQLTEVAVGTGSGTEQVQVDVSATTSAYEERNASGAVLRSQPAGLAKALRLSLVRSNGRWWLSEITIPGN
ncbi:serine/threonine protein kinase [Paenarthrobacter nitroguajacolicus]|uniref:serine/threonine protein kinase n=1 Tax=Paenarthrobacter nitroguajacolicus TaxID=211146 RepID=UPI00248AEB9B|nr:serine/threonine-protein kinase [Paenarthrobacter nitroguajacolicus]MDI2037326.1 hypothetical protein [Paenarthrobacter nitroguajacolicus]